MRKIITLIGILAGIFLVALIAFGYSLNIMNTKDKKSIDISYDDITCQISCNDDYVAYWEENKIVVQKYDGTEVTTFYPEQGGIAPDQIVLGEQGYYLLEWEDTSTEDFFDAVIMQLDYQSQIKKQIKVQNAAQLACKDGYLFIGKWIGEKQICPNYLNGFYANYYIDEKKFGETLNKIESDPNKVVRIGKTQLYYNSEGYYCTEPEINDYRLLEGVDWGSGDMCQLNEYQSGRFVFGVCNFYDELVFIVK